MDKLFLTILNMSLTGTFVIAAICLVRLPLKKAPKIISYCLWAVAGFRLVFPFSIESVFSLVPFKAQTIPRDIATQTVPRIDSGIPFVNNAVSSVLPATAPTASVNPLQLWITIGAFVWFIGVVAMVVYGVVSFAILKRKMREAAHLEANIYEAENIKSPFVLGVFNPKIYLPIGLSEQEKSYIILHEQTHIRRHDHIVKFAAYFILCLHWFNPIVWAAFLLTGIDMEMSCDERVLKEMGGEAKKDYSLSLLSLATERRIIGGSPLAFGEGGIKERIKNVMNFKKPSRAVITVSVTLVLALSIGFAANRASVNTLPRADDVLSVAQTYSLENPTDKQKLERLASVTLYENGTAELATPFISSYLLPACTYSFVENELLIYANIETPELESAYGVNNGDVIARFTVADDGALVFESAAVPLFADAGARYVSVPMTLDDLNALSALRTPYVGDNSAVGRIIYALPQLDNEHTQQYFSIGDDYGTGRVPFTLTIYYEPIDAEVSDTRNITVTPKNAALLFALINNLEEVNFAFRNTPSDGELDTSVYVSRVSYSKENITEYLESIGLTWEDFGNDWIGSIEKMYAVPSVSADLEASVSEAILETNKDDYAAGDLAVEAHTTLATVEEGDTVTVYLMALYQVYRYSGGGFSEISGGHMPVAITFDRGSDGGYAMTEYWMPQDGTYYASSIKEKFPQDIYEDAIDTQKYIYAHVMSCYEQAIEYGDVDTDYQIASLIETICSSPAEASNPGAYIEAHSIEFRELVYYGRYTLDYCFSLFEQGSQTGLEGHIMAAACRDIMTALGKKVTEGNFDTGQDWYNAQSASK